MSGMPLNILFSLTDPLGPPSPEAPLSETSTIDGVVQLAAVLQIVEQAADLVVGWLRNPAYTSAMRPNRRFSSLDE